MKIHSCDKILISDMLKKPQKFYQNVSHSAFFLSNVVLKVTKTAVWKNSPLQSKEKSEQKIVCR